MPSENGGAPGKSLATQLGRPLLSLQKRVGDTGTRNILRGWREKADVSEITSLYDPLGSRFRRSDILAFSSADALSLDDNLTCTLRDSLYLIVSDRKTALA